MSFRILRYIFAHRKVVVWSIIIPAFLALLFVVIADSKFRSETLLMPPMEEGSEGLIAAYMASMNLPSMVVPMTGGSMTAAILVDILETRAIAEAVITGQGLMEWYKSDSMYEAIQELRAKTSITASATGMIKLSVIDVEPKKAADILNSYITNLDSLNRQLQYTRAGNTMEFIGRQIEEYRERLAGSRRQIADFQSENGIVDFDEQIRGTIDVAAALKVRAVIAEIELDMLREFSTENASALKRSEMELESLTGQLEKIMRSDSSSSVFIPLSSMPELYQQYAAYNRDLEVNERVYSFLLQRYEETGIERARTTPSVQVVDKPSIPVKRAGIPRWGIVMIAGGVGLIWSCLFLAWWAWISGKGREKEEEEAFQDLLELFRKDTLALKKRLRL
ncbi:MAG: hypothetical protein KOO63_15415 [Bacteroidales bacterium]|nr:hypothetical protein [Candidatus Latescibacterota bacterium]